MYLPLQTLLSTARLYSANGFSTKRPMQKETVSGTEPGLSRKVLNKNEGIIYQEGFSLMTKFETKGFFIGYVAVEDMEVEQVDNKTTFLNGKLEEEIFIGISEIQETLKNLYNAGNTKSKV